jgi:AraC-like DNA-binding protein
MDLVPDMRLSDSPFVERIWQSHSENGGAFISMAERHYSLVLTRFERHMFITVRGPETQATPACLPQGAAEFIGILFTAGTFLVDFPASMVQNRQDETLPAASEGSFWLHGSSWQYPTFENADTFVDRLIRDDLLAHDAVVDATLNDIPLDLSPRTLQRHFVQAMGLSLTDLRQMERARYATVLLKQGETPISVIAKAGYFDQAHMIRSMRRFVGLTPNQIANPKRTETLSFLYNTAPLWREYTLRDGPNSTTQELPDATTRLADLRWDRRCLGGK